MYDIDIEKVLYAIAHHYLGKVSKDKLIGSIWDADRLSLYRFKGREVDINRLSTEAAKELLEYFKKVYSFSYERLRDRL